MNAQAAALPPKRSISTLLAEIVDYAGLFPPSLLPMKDAVANYAQYRSGEHGWMLGRFVLPVARLNEFLDAGEDLFSDGDPWRLSVLAGEDIAATIREIKLFNSQNAGRAVCDSLEVKANTVSKIENTVAALPEDLTTYFEISTGENFADLLSMLSIKRQRAKIRSGGTTHEDFPPTREIVRFVRTCMAANVPNVLLMTGFARESFCLALLEELMEEEFDEIFAFRDDGVAWRGEYFLSAAQLEILRRKGMISFGSCSFTEPVEDLKALGLL